MQIDISINMLIELLSFKCVTIYMHVPDTGNCSDSFYDDMSALSEEESVFCHVFTTSLMAKNLVTVTGTS